MPSSAFRLAAAMPRRQYKNAHDFNAAAPAAAWHGINCAISAGLRAYRQSLSRQKSIKQRPPAHGTSRPWPLTPVAVLPHGPFKEAATCFELGASRRPAPARAQQPRASSYHFRASSAASRGAPHVCYYERAFRSRVTGRRRRDIRHITATVRRAIAPASRHGKSAYANFKPTRHYYRHLFYRHARSRAFDNSIRVDDVEDARQNIGPLHQLAEMLARRASPAASPLILDAPPRPSPGAARRRRFDDDDIILGRWGLAMPMQGRDGCRLDGRRRRRLS